MTLPEGVTEVDFVSVVEKVLDLVVRKAKPVPGYDIGDMRQFGFVQAIEAIGRFDPQRGTLAEFLYRHILNRLKNLFRDQVFRPGSPCKSCERTGTCPKGNGGHCKKHRDYVRRNEAKASANSPVPLVFHSADPEVDGLEIPEAVGPDSTAMATEQSDLEKEIDEYLPTELRANYLRIRAGLLVSKRERLEVQAAVREILEAEGVDIAC